MDSTKRIIVNTAAQYAKAVINTCLALFSTRLVLDALTVADFGIYALVAGVVSMLGFITNALVITTQRYISFYHGRGDIGYVKKLFSNSLLLHILLSLTIAGILVAIKGWLFDSVLTIDPSRIDTAINVYYITTFILFVTILMAPFKALFIARENIVFISVVEICDSVIKLLLVIGLAYIDADKLLVYAFMMASIQLLNLLVFSSYAKLRFTECSLTVRRRDVDRQAMAQLVGFAGWTTYGAGALAARNQGINIIINHFAGTVANAAYGVAAQVNAAIFFVSSSIVNAMNPQIMQAEGEGDRQRVLKLAGQESKYSAILLSIAAIPMLFEMPTILSLWLKEVPENTAMFCTFTLASCLVDQFTIGLNAVNQAQGKIGTYSMLMFTPKLIVLPIAWWLLQTGWSLVSVMWAYIIVEAIVAAIRIPFMKATAGLDVSAYIRHTVLPLLPLIATMMLVSWACTQSLHFPFRFLFSIPSSIILGLIVAWSFTLTQAEQLYITTLVKSKMRK